MNILISGIPGTGKTHIGDYLAKHHGFKHFDLESENGQMLVGLLQHNRFDDFVGHLAQTGNSNILTLGYPPDWLPLVKEIAKRGVKTVWLDAPILFSRKNWRPNPGQDPRTYSAQMVNIINRHAELNEFYAGKKVCVTDQTGEKFVSAKQIADLILTIVEA